MIPAIPLAYASRHLYSDTHLYAPTLAASRRTERSRRRRALTLPRRVSLWVRPAPHV